MATGTFISSTGSSTDASSYTVTGASLGTAAADRYIILVVGGDSSDGSAAGTPTCTVQGISATRLATRTNGRDCLSQFAVAVPTGTTGDIVIDFGETMRNYGVGWWSVTGISETTPYDIEQSGAGDANPVSVSIDIPTNAFVIGGTHNADGAQTWTGLTERFDDINEFGVVTTSGADGTPAEQTGYAVSANNGSAGSRYLMMVTSWGGGGASTAVKDLISSGLIPFAR